MSDNNETFYKIGIAVDIRNRFRKRRKDYNIEIISVKIFEDGGLTYDKEVELHRKCKDFKYQPLKKFSGNTERYNFNNQVLEIFNQS